MLDPRIQERLKPSIQRKSLGYVRPIVIGLVPALMGAYFYFTNVEAVSDQQLGKLAVLAAASLEESPAGIWVLMERFIGKPQDKFTADDSMRAVKYLVNRIDASAMKKEKISAARFDL